MTSAQPQRTSPYSDELRWRMVYQCYGLQLTYRQIARNLNVDVSTVCRVINRYQETGNVSKRRHPNGHDHHMKRLIPTDEFLILELVAEKPGIYLRELQAEIYKNTGTHISVISICTFLHKNGFTHRKLSRVSGQRDDFLRSQFMEDLSIFSIDMLVFVDESGSDNRDALRKFGYSLRGQPAKALSLFPRGKHLSAIAAMSCDGVLGCQIHEGGVNSEAFQGFLDMELAPKLLPFNGTNCRSVVVMDNASIHHADQLVNSLEHLGVLVYFLPPYSPDFNPIEELFSKVKLVMKANEYVLKDYDLETSILCGFISVTSDDCVNWINHSGYH